MSEPTPDTPDGAEVTETAEANPGSANASRPGKPVGSAKARTARRRFIRTTVLTSGILGLALMGYLPVARGGGKPLLRPPGALDENDFLSSCIKCGQCVQVCPVQAIKLGDITDGFGLGAPYIHPRTQACDFSCDAGQCILACPTGALTYTKPDFLKPRAGAPLAHLPTLKAKEKDPEPTLNLKERMGLARLAHPDACLANQGKGFKGQARGADFKGEMRYMDVDRWKPIPVRDHPYERDLCDLCVTECPIKDAIRMKLVDKGDGVKRAVPEVLEQCVGCGVCEMICPADANGSAAIVVDQRHTWEA